MILTPDKPLSLDLETNTAGGPLDQIEIRLVSLSNTPTEATCYAATPEILERLQQGLNITRNLVGQNTAAFDMLVLEDKGIMFPWNRATEAEEQMAVWDTMLMHHILWPTLSHDLGTLGRRYTTKPFWKDWRGEGDAEELYACRDADGTLQIWQKIYAEMVRQPKLLDVYRYVSLPLARICVHMSQNGITRDPKRIEILFENTRRQMGVEEQNLPEVLRTFTVTKNERVKAPEGTLSAKTKKPLKFVMVPYEEEVRPWASSKQVGTWLYDTKGFEEQLNDEGRRTSGKVALDKLAHKYDDPSISAVRKLRTYASRLLYCPRNEDGSPVTELERLHPSFLPHGTAFGRLSSSGPNIQNWEEDVRVIVVPSEPDWVIFALDYSQIEPRLTAWFSQDRERLKRFDIPKFNEHKWVASLFFDLPYKFDIAAMKMLEDGVTKDNDKDAPYGKAKRINNGKNYLLGYKSISKMYDWDLQETRKLSVQWDRFMPVCVDWQRATVAEAKQRKMLTNPFNRAGLFYMPNSGPQATAFRPQSTAADIVIRAKIGVLYERIKWPLWKVHKVMRVARPLPHPARIFASVHDQLVGECPRELLPEVMDCCSEVMCQPWPELDGFSIPVTKEWGPSWGELEAYKG